MTSTSGQVGRFRIGEGAIGRADGVMAPLGFDRIADLSVPVGLSPPDGANVALVAAELSSVRFRDDGVDPTPSLGMPLARDVPLLYEGDLLAVRFVEQTPGAVLNVLFYAA